MKRLYWLMLICTVVAFPSSVFSQALSVSLDTSHVYFDPQDPLTFSMTLGGSIRNLTDDTISVEFVRTQKLAKGWTTNICFGLNCYADKVSQSTEVWAPKEDRGLKVLINVPPSPTGEAEIGLVIRSRAGDSVYFVLSASALPWEPVECRMLRFYNDDTSRFIVTQVWLSDTANFSMTPQFELPLLMRANSFADYELCLKPQDGKDYTATVYYGNDTSVKSVEVTMKAIPLLSVALEQRSGPSWLLANIVANAGSFVYNTGSSTAVPMTIQVADLSGKIVFATAVHESKGEIAVPALPNGLYFVTFSLNGKPVNTEKIMIR